MVQHLAFRHPTVRCLRAIMLDPIQLILCTIAMSVKAVLADATLPEADRPNRPQRS